jgi:hypothetical protein
MRKQKAQIQKIIKEWKDASPKEVWEGDLGLLSIGIKYAMNND